LGIVTVTGNQAGGLAADMWGDSFVSMTYAMGNVTGQSGVGGLVGNPQSGDIRHSIGHNAQIVSTNNSASIGRVAGNKSEDYNLFQNNHGYEKMKVAGIRVSSTDAASRDGNDFLGFYEIQAAEIRDPAPLESWDFDALDEDGNGIYWHWDEDISRPVLYVDLQENGTFVRLGNDTRLIEPVVDETPSEFAGGAGSVDNPYRVATAEQLYKVRDYLDKRFIQTADIDLSGYSAGEGWEPIPGFAGSFDGGGYTISNLTINRPSSNLVGLFGTSSGTINNVCLSNVSIIGGDDVGGLVGDNVGGVIRDSSVSGNVTGNTTWFGSVGGLVGTISSWGGISRSFSTANVTGNYHVGGLVGDTSGGTVSNCYATGSVTASNQYAGGIAGRSALSPSLINNCYATGTVTAPSYAGGLTGSGAATGYYDQQRTGLSTGGGTPKTTEEMKQQATYVSWDFDTTWGINRDENNGYPFLRWQGYEHQPALSATLLGHWTFDESVGEAVYDSSGNDYHGTIQGATWTGDRDGKAGKALECGVNKWVNIPDTLKPEEITVCAWVYITGTDGSVAPIFSAEQGSGATGFAYRLQITPDAKLRMEAIAPYSASGARVATSADSLNLNQWYHVAGTYDGYETKIYINGVLDESVSAGTYAALNTDLGIPVAIGHLEDWGVQWFRGVIDDARIYDGVLGAGEVLSLCSDL